MDNSRGQFVPGRRTPVDSNSLVQESRVSGSDFPVIAEAVVRGVNLAAWTSNRREWLDERLRTAGAVLFRGFTKSALSDFERLVAALSGPLMEYSHRSTPRTQIQGRVYTSTEYPSDRSIPLHNEMSYTDSWPARLWFLCVIEPKSGGETPLADSRAVFSRVPDRIRQRFETHGVMYIRNYHEGVDLSWRDVFNTDDKSVVEKICRGARIDFEWVGGTRLRTRQVCQAVVRHPLTGDMVWFNQAHLFHISNLAAEEQAELRASFAEPDLPRHAMYGDGSPIATSDLEEIRRAYDASSVVFPWRESDVLAVDNVLVAHGRRPFQGPRQIAVAMTGPPVPASGI